MDFKIKIKKYNSDSCQSKEFVAVDNNGKEIFGASAIITKYLDVKTEKWEDWKISWGSTGSNSYDEKLPKFECIKIAMKELKKLNN